ncbi:2-oxo acid dehydrogenase subunit E2 [Micrococcales bacterium 31B]|nr:2-oxo acid dehydrogenase subunit E2 [Micrococcales bacterium 31B]
MGAIMRMPEVLTGMVEATVNSWLIAEGAAVDVGTPIAEVETEKATVEIAADAAGVVTRFLVDANQPLVVGAPLLELDGGDGTSEANPAPRASDTPALAPTLASGDAPVVAPAAPARLFASPLVRRLARERGLDLAGIRGTGPGGRIVRRDLEALVADTPQTPVAPAAGRRLELSSMRRAIARRLTESKSTVPHFYLTAQCDVSALLALRSDVNAVRPTKVSVNDFVVLAIARALVEVPRANLIWGGDHVLAFDSANIAIAVATEDGLLTPVVRDANTLTLSQISSTIADLAKRARAGTLRHDELSGGSFAVSNLGMYGVEEFSAILNPPQSGILAVGAISDRVVAVDGQPRVRPMMSVTVSWDHRAVDGAVGADWLRTFVDLINHPLRLLV